MAIEANKKSDHWYTNNYSFSSSNLVWLTNFFADAILSTFSLSLGLLLANFARSAMDKILLRTI